MKVSHQENILYKSRLSHERDPLVAKGQPSTINNNNINITPLERASNEISFKGIFSFKDVKFSFKAVKKSLAFFNEKDYNLKENLDLLSKHIGKTPQSLSKEIDSWNQIKAFIKKSDDGASVKILEKNWTRLLLEGIAYPAEIPFHIAASVKKAFTKKDAGKLIENAAKNGEKNIGYIKNKFETLNNTDIVNSFTGYMESAKKYKHDTDKVASAGLFTNAMKMFDPKSGNYNGVHERALTRIVTGFIPAFFLANDAYNLSRICDDDSKAADKEKKIRFNQETKRVLSNAYLQLITLGALSKYINRSKGTFIGVTAASVLATESFSRLSNGKKIHFINKEEAIKLNKEHPEKESQNTVDSAKKQPFAPTSKSKPGFKSSRTFNGFGMISDLPFNQTNSIAMSGAHNDSNENKQTKESKPLLNLSSIAKWFVGTIALGFALKYAKNLNVKNGIIVKDYLNVISKKYENLYEKITRKDYNIKNEDFKKIIEKLKNYDEVIAGKFETVTRTHQKSKMLNKEAKNLADVLEKAGLNDFAQHFKHIANSDSNKTFADIEKYNAAQLFLKGRDEKVITKNLNELFEKMQKADLNKEVDEIKALIFDQNNNVITENFNKAQKLLDEKAKEYAFTFKNRFAVDKNEENLELFQKAVSELKKINPKAAAEFENKINDAAHAEVLSLGKKNIRYVKEIADFITEPFKFIWGTVTLPYKHVAKPFYKTIKPENQLPEWAKELDAVSNTIQKITQKSKLKQVSKMDLPQEEFVAYMGKQLHKAHNTSTMSSLSNSDLSALAKNTSTAATAWFLMADNHNMVMQKSNGNDKNGAVSKAKERAVQETSRTFYNVMFINLFNTTFRSLYNNSLFGAQTVNTASTLIGEYVNRKAIGMPVKASSRDEILNQEYENITSKGPKGGFFRFMTRLTGKKVLSQREPVKKSVKQEEIKK